MRPKSAYNLLVSWRHPVTLTPALAGATNRLNISAERAHVPKQAQASSYYVHTVPGLQKVAWTEIQATLRRTTFRAIRESPGKNGIVSFDYDGPPHELLALRTTEDVFFQAKHSKIAWGYEGLSQVYEAMQQIRSLERGMEASREVTQRPLGRRVNFRVISRMSSKNQPYRRLDFQKAVEKAIEKGSRHRWHAVREGEDVEIWANLLGLDFLCGLRLSDARMRHREYKTQSIPASLRPSVAASMVWLTHPQPTDIFLDPLCGAGTLLVERGMIARHALLLGGDLDDAALQAAAENIGRKHRPRQLSRWDARCLPLPAQSVDKVATNLPFGIKVAPGEDLYPAFFLELSRVLAARGRAVVLTNKAGRIKDIVKGIPSLRMAGAYGITLLGRGATISIISRPP